MATSALEAESGSGPALDSASGSGSGSSEDPSRGAGSEGGSAGGGGGGGGGKEGGRARPEEALGPTCQARAGAGVVVAVAVAAGLAAAAVEASMRSCPSSIWSALQMRCLYCPMDASPMKLTRVGPE